GRGGGTHTRAATARACCPGRRPLRGGLRPGGGAGEWRSLRSALGREGKDGSAPAVRGRAGAETALLEAAGEDQVGSIRYLRQHGDRVVVRHRVRLIAVDAG